MSLATRALAAALLSPATAIPAAADTVLLVEFQERETGDTFHLSNVAPCPGIRIAEVSIDLGTSAGGLVFDVWAGGEGYADERTGGIHVQRGARFIDSASRVEDGGEVVTFQLDDFMPGDSVRVSLDVDDPENGIVPGPDDDASARDMAGAAVAARMVNAAGFERAEITAFGEIGNARLAWKRACVTGEASPIDPYPEGAPFAD